jgi:hypothetical protein
LASTMSTRPTIRARKSPNSEPAMKRLHTTF